MPFWLVILFCVEGAGCGPRLVDKPWGDMLKCSVAAQALVQARVGYRPLFTCTATRPEGVPLAPPFVAPERWTRLETVRTVA